MLNDHFSALSAQYSKFRPQYPESLFKYLASISPSTNKVWDCACGSGQAAIGLNKYFTEVVATDASSKQLSNAFQQQGILYRLASAEKSGLPDSEVDLITVAQALHWFDLRAFFSEAERVLTRKGILAVWTYNLLQINAIIDPVIQTLYSELLGKFWPPERKYVESGYTEFDFPFTAINCPSFCMSATWNVHQLIGYLETWSAVKHYRGQGKHTTLDGILSELEKLWGNGNDVKEVIWPLTVIVRQKM